MFKQLNSVSFIPRPTRHPSHSHEKVTMDRQNKAKNYDVGKGRVQVVQVLCVS